MGKLKAIIPRSQFYWRYRNAFCKKCGINILAVIRIDIETCWSKNNNGTTTYYCNTCKQEIFEGIKYHV